MVNSSFLFFNALAHFLIISYHALAHETSIFLLYLKFLGFFRVNKYDKKALVLLVPGLFINLFT